MSPPSSEEQAAPRPKRGRTNAMSLASARRALPGRSVREAAIVSGVSVAGFAAGFGRSPFCTRRCRKAMVICCVLMPMGQRGSQDPQRMHACAEGASSSSVAPPIEARFLPQEVSALVWCCRQTGQESMQTPQPLHCVGSVEALSYSLDRIIFVILRRTGGEDGERPDHQAFQQGVKGSLHVPRLRMKCAFSYQNITSLFRIMAGSTSLFTARCLSTRASPKTRRM